MHLIKKGLIIIYQIVPSTLRYKFAGSRLTKGFRDCFLRSNGGFSSTKVHVRKKYNDQTIEFDFYASLAVAAKAEKSGIETALLRKSLELLEKRLGNKACDSVIIDVGANFGFLSLVWASFVKQGKGYVYAFEPEKNLASCIKMSAESNSLQSHIKVYEKGISSSQEPISLYTFPGGASGNPNQGFTEVVKVSATSIDCFVSETNLTTIDLLKIDVDSIEFQILQASENSIKHFKPIIFSETNGNRNILDLLDSWSYKVYDLYGNCVSEGELPHDIFAIHESYCL